MRFGGAIFGGGFFLGGIGTSFNDNNELANRFFSIFAGNNGDSGTEALRQNVLSMAIRLDLWMLRCRTNLKTGSVVFTVRRNSAIANSIITIGAGLTGNFQDVTNSDDFVTGDTIGGDSDSTGSGLFTIELNGCSWRGLVT